MTEELDRELRHLGVPLHKRRRICAEISDHLRCNPDAQMGDPTLLARQFADEIGTAQTLRSVVGGFGALAFTGLLYGLFFGFATITHPRFAATLSRSWLGNLALVLVFLAPQVSFASGVLALLRAWRRRGQAHIVIGDARALRRRAGIAIASGLATVAGIALLLREYPTMVDSRLMLVVYVPIAAAVVALVMAMSRLWRASRIAISTKGNGGDIRDDLAALLPAQLLPDPWRLAAGVAISAGLLVTIAGVLQGDPYDAMLRGAVESLACLMGFVLLGPYFSLWVRKGNPEGAA